MSSTKKQPQGPSGYPFVGNIFNLAGPKRLEWLQSLADKYGDVVSFKLLKKDMYLVNHPDLVKEMLTHKSHNYTKKTIGFKKTKQ